MIDFLSDPIWINPQIDFLLFLQNIRTSYLENFDKLFLSVTIFGEFWLPTLVCAIVYWCIDFKAGIYLFSLEGINMLLAHLFKMISCVYRPWILNDNVKPSQLAYALASGYSFPSGHSAMSSSVFGGLAYLIKNNKKLCITLICFVLLVGFSRMWLGVHTPQDVICGFLIGFIIVFSFEKVINWAEINKNRYLYLTILIDIFAFVTIIYLVFFNNYRVDYVGESILVDPQKSIYNTLTLYGYALGILNGCFICRRFFPYDTKSVPKKNLIVRGIIGSIGIILIIKPLIAFILTNIINYKIATVLMFLAGFSVTLLYPIIFIKLSKKFPKLRI
ncbi:phosphatase PAP2 family protein [bacterium]|nr:phosphatase PAP2 family protein [bacterium]